ncbi:MAG TPA: hypothetical protein VET65_09040 [Candidatus Limnocylindrales bacterium]|nr:hypothetical protein [Candidatus Limnocylindrales bacterium]
MNGYEFDLAKSRMNSFIAEAQHEALVTRAAREGRAARTAARMARAGVAPVRKAWVLAGAAFHSLAS